MKIRLILPCLALIGLLAAATTASAQALSPGQHSAAVNGAQIAYTVTGSSGPTIFLIHGYPLNGSLFARQRQAFGTSYQVVTVDLPGFGASTAPNDQATIDEYANDMLALLTQLDISKAIIGGHSMGGAIALRMYQLSPDVFTGMILNDAAAFPPSIVEQNMWQGYQEQTRAGGDPHGFIALLLPEFLTGHTRNTRPNLVAKVSKMIRAASTNGLIGGAHALQTRPDVTGVFSQITVPTLIIYGAEDSLTPMEQAVKLHDMISGSQLTVVPGATHGVIREAAETANSAISDWLNANF